ncbi:hypothetical protein IWX90DRAFT_61249 [Phyllosticta citrichinensis]|uniref:Uncharacterized protein n=1 Tax=Phyllosticta citrichinensis TaxID=1130410 RepID=A0ABR1XH01_9PEZI
MDERTSRRRRCRNGHRSDCSHSAQSTSNQPTTHMPTTESVHSSARHALSSSRVSVVHPVHPVESSHEVTRWCGASGLGAEIRRRRGRHHHPPIYRARPSMHNTRHVHTDIQRICARAGYLPPNLDCSQSTAPNSLNSVFSRCWQEKEEEAWEAVVVRERLAAIGLDNTRQLSKVPVPTSTVPAPVCVAYSYHCLSDLANVWLSVSFLGVCLF